MYIYISTAKVEVCNKLENFTLNKHTHYTVPQTKIVEHMTLLLM